MIDAISDKVEKELNFMIDTNKISDEEAIKLKQSFRIACIALEDLLVIVNMQDKHNREKIKEVSNDLIELKNNLEKEIKALLRGNECQEVLSEKIIYFINSEHGKAILFKNFDAYVKKYLKILTYIFWAILAIGGSSIVTNMVNGGNKAVKEVIENVQVD